MNEIETIKDLDRDFTQSIGRNELKKSAINDIKHFKKIIDSDDSGYDELIKAEAKIEYIKVKFNIEDLK